MSSDCETPWLLLNSELRWQKPFYTRAKVKLKKKRKRSLKKDAITG